MKWTCSVPSSSGTASGSSSRSSTASGSEARRFASSPRRTWARPSDAPWTGWCANSAPRSRSSTTPSAPGCTPRRGCSAATTGFDTAYVGSSNLSRAALLDGVEWNVRLSRSGDAALLEKFRATFDTYWNDSGVRDLRPGPGSRSSRRRAGRGVGRDSTRPRDHLAVRAGGAPVPLPAGDAGRARRRAHRPRPAPQPGRGRDRHRARRSSPRWTTGGLCDADRRPPSLLFVAHREEILEQSLRTYREVLGRRGLRRAVRRRQRARNAGSTSSPASSR